MAFSFGQNTQQSQPFGASTSTFGSFGGGGGGFGQQQQPQQGFGGFGQTATSSAAPTFGGGTANTFGSTGFGAPAFGTPQQQQQTGSTFGASTSTAPAFGGGGGIFGTGGSTTGTGFGGGSAFGSSGGTFGTQQQQQSTTGFGGLSTGGFGAKPTGFGTSFGTPQQQTSTGFGTVTSTAPAFGTGGSTFGTGTSFSSGFGAQQTGGFGSGLSAQSFGAKPTSLGTGSFGSFGTGTGGSLFGSSQPTFGAQPQQQQQQLNQQQQLQAASQDEQSAFHQSIFTCCKFGDERDGILANFNYIQACWGAGKGYFNQSNNPVTYTDKNVLYRFKAVGYSFMFENINEDGNVVVEIKKPHSKVSEQEAQLITSLQTMFNKPNIFFRIQGSKPVSEESTMVVINAEDRISYRRILATDLASALSQPQFKAQLDNLGIVNVTAKIRPSPEQLRAYLDTPPAGLDPRVWKRAQEDNPDPLSMIPMPLLGPLQLKNRSDAQQKETTQHAERLRIIVEEVTTLYNRHANIFGELKQIKARMVMLRHRVLADIGRMMVTQMHSVPVQPEEQELRKQMIEIDKVLNSPTHFRGRLNVLLSHIRVQKSGQESKQTVKYAVDNPALDQVKDFLNQQQESIVHLVDTVKSAMDLTERMNEEMIELGDKSLTP